MRQDASSGVSVRSVVFAIVQCVEKPILGLVAGQVEVDRDARGGQALLALDLDAAFRAPAIERASQRIDILSMIERVDHHRHFATPSRYDWTFERELDEILLNCKANSLAALMPAKYGTKLSQTETSYLKSIRIFSWASVPADEAEGFPHVPGYRGRGK